MASPEDSLSIASAATTDNDKPSAEPLVKTASITGSASTTQESPSNVITSNEQLASNAADITPLLAANLVDKNWLLNQKSTEFTIQFGSSPDRNLLEEFIPLLETSEPITIYPYKKTPTNRPVYGLATGLFPDIDTAIGHIETLSATAREFDPWVRPIGDLKQLISNFGNSP